MNKPSKMKCERVQEDAIALLGVELTDDEEQMVYAHLSDCPRCREEFRRDRKAWQAISSCPAVTADASFNRMLSLRLSLEEHEPRPEQVDRVLPALETDDVTQDVRYDLSRLASVFASAMPQ
jgi:anti-sigma factor RsiW